MLVRVKVTAGAGAEYFGEAERGGFEAYVKEPPAGNMANNRVLAVVAAHFRVPVAKVRIVSGHHARSKIIDVRE